MNCIIAVTKSLVNGGKHRSKYGEKRWKVFYYDENDHFHTKFVSTITAMMYKTKIVKRLIMSCPQCKRRFVIYSRNKHQKVNCPRCIN